MKFKNNKKCSKIIVLMLCSSAAFANSTVHTNLFDTSKVPSRFNIVTTGNSTTYKVERDATNNSKQGSHQMGSMNMGTQSSTPFGIMGGHSHKANQFMMVYRYKLMQMDGDLMSGGESIQLSDATDYMNLPLEMSMQMHMVGIMYAPIDNLVLRAMQSYQLKSMTMQNRMMSSTVTTQNTEGFGDLTIGAGYTLFTRHRHPVNHVLHADLLVGFPTGSIDEENDSNGKNQSYMLQLGSGSYELRPALAYSASARKLSWGSQFKSIIRLNENANKYQLGNQYEFNIWSSIKVLQWLDLTLRFNATLQEDIAGSDPNQVSEAMMPGADPNAYGYKLIMALAGLNFQLPHRGPIMFNMGVEGGIPVYQYRNGIQRALSYMLTAGFKVMTTF